MPYHVYVIALKSEFGTTAKARRANPGFLPGRRCYYVGYTSRTPGRRYIQHMAGGLSQKGHNLASKVVHKFGVFPQGLKPEIFEVYNPIRTKAEAEKVEKWLAEKLRKEGHCVWQN